MNRRIFGKTYLKKLSLRYLHVSPFGETEYVRDLQRCLRREDPEVRIITLQLGRWRFVSRHVLPLLIGASTSGDRDLAAAVGTMRSGC